jgi:hypothetical protein
VNQQIENANHVELKPHHEYCGKARPQSLFSSYSTSTTIPWDVAKSRSREVEQSQVLLDLGLGAVLGITSNRRIQLYTFNHGRLIKLLTLARHINPLIMMARTYSSPHDCHAMLLSDNVGFFNSTRPFVESSNNLVNTFLLNQPCSTVVLSHPDGIRLSLTATIEARIA